MRTVKEIQSYGLDKVAVIFVEYKVKDVEYTVEESMI